ncbi:hypothetical protein ACFY4K_33145 [Streptomyces leeuwenhoekii]|uniref:hypothetical protein n=1 Tax=Streptomyces leeuwenhoekii TaxID=1437453 RepID=UPI0036BF3C37
MRGGEGRRPVQQFAKRAPGFVQVADHPVLASAYFLVLAQSGDASLDEFHGLQAGLDQLPMERGQPDRWVVKAFQALEFSFITPSSFIALGFRQGDLGGPERQPRIGDHRWWLHYTGFSPTTGP